MAFGAPLVLLGLLTLPVIWWLLRLTPPKPKAEVFPPLRLLARVIKQEETPAKSPWWLTLLRLTLAALVILALARPLLNPQTATLSGDGPVLIMVDNGWTRPGQWEQRLDQARLIATEAGDAGRPVALSLTVEPRTAIASLDTADSALSVLDAASLIAAKPDRAAAFERLMTSLDGAPMSEATLVILSDGLAHSIAADDDAFAAALANNPPGEIQLYAPTSGEQPIIALSSASNGAQSLQATLITNAGTSEDAMVSAYDERGRLLAQAEAMLDTETNTISADFTEPFELRNDFAWLAIDDERHAAAVHLLDDSDRRRRVGLVTGVSFDSEQPLLSPLFYIRRAIEPFTDMIEGRTGDLSVDIPEILEQGPAVMVMADIGVVPPSAVEPLADWIEAGGTLVRFAGPRLARQSDNDPFLPVTLRLGERSLVGSLSWTEPQPVAPFPDGSPFADLAAPKDVSVERQVLAEPDADLNARTWAILADGTPLVTGREQGRGSIVLFHVTAEATWSNLPISGTFVEMLQRIADASSNTGTTVTSTATPISEATLPPARILQPDGQLVPPPASVEPLELAGAQILETSFENPAGLYGSDNSFAAINVINTDEDLASLALDPASAPVTALNYPTDSQSDLAPWLFAAALLLLFIDTLAVLWINGRFARPVRQAVAAASVATLLGGFALLIADTAIAQEAGDTPAIDEQTAIEFADTTRIAYVLTGVDATDAMTEAGLDGLSRFIASRTALEPGTPVGVDLELDELAFFPLIYYAIDANGVMPSEAAVARLDAYMQNGGTVLFDTRDQLTGVLEGGASAENRYLRDLLAGLNVPALEPVPSDHVLTKAFYILDTFPGRYAGSPLWVEAMPDTEERADRPVRTGDGVSPIMITGNDFASAWALDESGQPLAAIASGDPLQRIYAFRTGVNIMMYMLTGNYKADQVHVPALLERLGQ